MFRNVILISLALLATILLLNHRSAGGPPAELTLINAALHTLDPQQMSWNADIRVGLNLWEGLTILDPQSLRPVSGVAHLPAELSADGKVYTFHLRSDARWCNGDPVSAADFVRGWRRALEPGTAADYALLLADHIQGARAYYDWRNEAIRVIANLAQLERGEKLPPVARALTRQHLLEAGLPVEAETAGVTWSRMRRAFLTRHDALREQRWEAVGIKALNPRTLQVGLERPLPYFLELTALPVFLPIHESIELLRETSFGLGITGDGLVLYDTQWTKPDYHRNGYPGLISNNAFRLKQWQFRRRLKLKANPYHHRIHGGALQAVDILMYEDANTAFQAYETGVADWLMNLDVPYVDKLLMLSDEGSRPDIYMTPSFGTYFYNLNCGDQTLPDGRENPFHDPRVRKAFSIALDRELLSRKVAIKKNPPAYTLIPPQSITGYPIVRGHPRNVELANRLLDKAGYRNRASFPEVSILYSTASEHARVAEALARMWTLTLNVRVLLEGKESKTFGAQKAKHNYLIARGGWFGDYGDPTTFLDICASGNGNNDSAFSSIEFDTLLSEAARLTDPQLRMQKLSEAERLLVTEAFPIIPIWRYTHPSARRPWVKGVVPNPRELYPLQSVSIER